MKYIFVFRGLSERSVAQTTVNSLSWTPLGLAQNVCIDGQA